MILIVWSSGHGARDDLERMAHFAGQDIIVMPDADYRFRGGSAGSVWSFHA